MSHAADQPDLGPQARNIVATLAAPPSRCSRWSARNERHRGFLADPLGKAPDVAVENQVATTTIRGLPSPSSRRIKSCLMPRVLPYLGNGRFFI